MSPDSDEVVLAQLTQFERKLQQLQRELRGEDLAAVMKEMEEEKVSSGCLLFNINSRVFSFNKLVLNLGTTGHKHSTMLHS